MSVVCFPIDVRSARSISSPNIACPQTYSTGPLFSLQFAVLAINTNIFKRILDIQTYNRNCCFISDIEKFTQVSFRIFAVEFESVGGLRCPNLLLSDHQVVRGAMEHDWMVKTRRSKLSLKLPNLLHSSRKSSDNKRKKTRGFFFLNILEIC